MACVSPVISKDAKIIPFTELFLVEEAEAVRIYIINTEKLTYTLF